jgi:hypothetical protein
MAGAGSSGGGGGVGSGGIGSHAAGVGSDGSVSLAAGVGSSNNSSSNSGSSNMQQVPPQIHLGTVLPGNFDNEPLSIQQFMNLFHRSTEDTQSWIYCKFLASVFECIIPPNEDDRFLVCKFWEVNYTWDEDSILLRNYLQTFPNNLYSRLRQSYGFDRRWNGYPHAADQEVLLVQYDQTRVVPVGDTSQIIYGSVTKELFNTFFVQNRQRYTDTLKGMRAIGDRLSGAVTTMQTKALYYKDLYGDDNVSMETLVSDNPNGIQPPYTYIVVDNSRALPNYTHYA